MPMKKELPDRSDLRLRTADIAFKERVVIDLGGIQAELIHVGGDHADDSVNLNMSSV